jgi:hypothetical protein
VATDTGEINQSHFDGSRRSPRGQRRRLSTTPARGHPPDTSDPAAPPWHGRGGRRQDVT